MLELYDGKPSRTVLRRESGSNPADLAGTIFGGFAPNSQTAEVLSKALGSRTVMSGSVSKGGGKDSASRSLQMMERPLMTPDELKSIPRGQFVVMKTGTHPMQTRLRLFLDWGTPSVIPTCCRREPRVPWPMPANRSWSRPSSAATTHSRWRATRLPLPPKLQPPEAGRPTLRPDAPDGSRLPLRLSALMKGRSSLWDTSRKSISPT